MNAHKTIDKLLSNQRDFHYVKEHQSTATQPEQTGIKSSLQHPPC
jgi:hypothetical protein